MLFFLFPNDTLLDCHESTSSEGLLSEKECVEALKDMDPENAPGTDSFPSEFCKTFGTNKHLVCLVPMIRELFRYHRDEKSLKLHQKKTLIHTLLKTGVH